MSPFQSHEIYIIILKSSLQLVSPISSATKTACLKCPWAMLHAGVAASLSRLAVLEVRDMKRLERSCADVPPEVITNTLQVTNIPHLGKRNIIFKSAFSRGYVSSQEGILCKGPPFRELANGDTQPGDPNHSVLEANTCAKWSKLTKCQSFLKLRMNCCPILELNHCGLDVDLTVNPTLQSCTPANKHGTPTW